MAAAACEQLTCFFTVYIWWNILQWQKWSLGLLIRVIKPSYLTKLYCFQLAESTQTWLIGVCAGGYNSIYWKGRCELCRDTWTKFELRIWLHFCHLLGINHKVYSNVLFCSSNLSPSWAFCTLLHIVIKTTRDGAAIVTITSNWWNCIQQGWSRTFFNICVFLMTSLAIPPRVCAVTFIGGRPHMMWHKWR